MGYTENNIAHSSKYQVCPYDTLECNKNASRSEIHRAYRRLALLHHPCRKNIGQIHGNSLSKINYSFSQDSDGKQKEWKFLLIGAAFETLSNNTFRKKYDNIQYAKCNIGSRSNDMNNKDVSCFTPTTKMRNRSKFSPNGCTFDTLLPACSPKNTHKPFPKKSNKYEKGRIDHLNHYSNYLSENARVDDDDTTVNTRCSHSTSESYNTISLLQSASEDQLGGPLYEIYKARNHAPFTDPYRLFNQMFYSDIFHTNADNDFSSNSPLKSEEEKSDIVDALHVSQSNIPDSYKNSRLFSCVHMNDTFDSENTIRKSSSPTSPLINSNTTFTSMDINGSKITKIIRIKDDKQITRTEITKWNPKTEKNEITITVTKEDINFEEIKQSHSQQKDEGSIQVFKNWLYRSLVPQPHDRQDVSPSQSESSSIACCCEKSKPMDDSNQFKNLMKTINISTCGNSSSSVKQDSIKSHNKETTRSAVCKEVKKILYSCGPLIP